MEAGKYIVAIELGTSKIVGIVGVKNEDGRLNILATEKEDSAGCIKRGCIFNVEDTASKIQKIIKKLENRLSLKITKVYVGVGGQSVHSISHSVFRQLAEDTPITDMIINSLHAESRSFPVANAEIMDVIPNEYTIDNHLETQPKGTYASEIEAHLQLVVGRPSIKKNINRCIVERLKLPIAGYIMSVHADAAALLDDEEKSLGCALINFGAGTTTLSIYKDNFLRYVVTIPFGGRNITQDISSLNILMSEAERLKLAFGCAINNGEEPKGIGIEGIDSSKINYQELCRVTEARIEEIIANIVEQIKESGYKDQLSAGIILTGGASLLKELPELLARETKMSVQRGNLQKGITFSGHQEGGLTAYSQAIGLLLLGEENCVEKPITPKTEPTVEEPEKPENKEISDEKKKKEHEKKPKKSWNIFGAIEKMTDKVISSTENFLTDEEDANPPRKKN